MAGVPSDGKTRRSRTEQRIVARAVLCLMVVVSVVLQTSTPLAATAPDPEALHPANHREFWKKPPDSSNII